MSLMIDERLIANAGTNTCAAKMTQLFKDLNEHQSALAEIQYTLSTNCLIPAKRYAVSSVVADFQTESSVISVVANESELLDSSFESAYNNLKYHH